MVLLSVLLEPCNEECLTTITTTTTTITTITTTQCSHNHSKHLTSLIHSIPRHIKRSTKCVATQLSSSPARVAVFSAPVNCLALPKSVNKMCPIADNIQFSGLRSLLHQYKITLNA